jgi:hypothetical protein
MQAQVLHTRNQGWLLRRAIRAEGLPQSKHVHALKLLTSDFAPPVLDHGSLALPVLSLGLLRPDARCPSKRTSPTQVVEAWMASVVQAQHGRTRPLAPPPKTLPMGDCSRLWAGV